MLSVLRQSALFTVSSGNLMLCDCQQVYRIELAGNGYQASDRVSLDLSPLRPLRRYYGSTRTISPEFKTSPSSQR
jgi:hypothetical protein